MSPCPFCEIIAAVSAGQRADTVVFDDEVAVAFLDRSPVFKGHLLVVPRSHVVTLTDLPVADVGPFFERVQRLTNAVKSGLGTDGTFVAMNNTVSQSVAHLHVHIVPRHRKDGLRGFFWPRTKYSTADEAASYGARIAAAVNA